MSFTQLSLHGSFICQVEEGTKYRQAREKQALREGGKRSKKDEKSQRERSNKDEGVRGSSYSCWGPLWVKVHSISACCNQALSWADSSALVYSRL